VAASNYADSKKGKKNKKNNESTKQREEENSDPYDITLKKVPTGQKQ
jgi:hypothetical protein